MLWLSALKLPCENKSEFANFFEMPAGGSWKKGNVTHLSLLTNSVGLVRCCAVRATLQTIVYKMHEYSTLLYSGVFGVTCLSFARSQKIIYSKVNLLVSPKVRLLCRIQTGTKCYGKCLECWEQCLEQSADGEKTTCRSSSHIFATVEHQTWQLSLWYGDICYLNASAIC